MGVMASAWGCSSPAPARDEGRDVAPHVDHHVHILSPGLVQDWKHLGVPFSRPDSAYTSVTAALREGSASHAFLVSMAHIYGSREFQRAFELSVDDEHARVRSANDHVASEVRRDPERFVGFCSFNPLRPYGLTEMRRCLDGTNLLGIKLHLPNSNVDLSVEEHRLILSEVFSEAARHRTPLLVHFMAAGAVPSEASLEYFWNELVAPHAELELILAHVGGGGGYGRASRSVLRSAIRFLEQGNSRARVHVELSGAVLAQRTDGVPASAQSDILELARDLRRLGLDRVYFGSDYPVFQPKQSVDNLRRLLPLTPEEMDGILLNHSSHFDGSLGSGSAGTRP
jgi:uncharacterized protein